MAEPRRITTRTWVAEPAGREPARPAARVDGGLRIRRSTTLQGSLVTDEGVERYFGEPALQPRLLAPAAGAPAKRYLEWHKRHVFRGDRL